MSSSSIKTIIGGAGFRCDGIKGSTEKQQRNFTPLQLNAVNHFTVQVVHTSVLHESARGWNRISKQIGHCRWSRMAGLLVLSSGTSRLGEQCGGKIPLMQVLIVVGRPLGYACACLSPLGLTDLVLSIDAHGSRHACCLPYGNFQDNE